MLGSAGWPSGRPADPSMRGRRGAGCRGREAPAWEKQVQGDKLHPGPADTFLASPEEPGHKPADRTARLWAPSGVHGRGYGGVSGSGFDVAHTFFLRNCRGLQVCYLVEATGAQRRVFPGLNSTHPAQNQPLGLGPEASDSE